MHGAGVDVGSTQTKAVILDENANIVGKSLTNTGANVVGAAQKAFSMALDEGGLDEWEVDFVVGTGYGRFAVPFGHAQVTEISCHARGANRVFPKTRTILDIGGQDTKAIKIDETGTVVDFCMNDKCAAGTGRFLEACAGVMDIALDDLGAVSLEAQEALRITNVCTVFVESEIVSHLARGKHREDILMGVHNAIAGRSVSLLRRVGLEEEITFTGGVSRNSGMVAALEERLEMKINASEMSHYMGALGASIFAMERAASGEQGRGDLVREAVTIEPPKKGGR